jgi:hypothetical protein
MSWQWGGWDNTDLVDSVVDDAGYFEVLEDGRSEGCLRTDEELIWGFGGGCVEIFGQ